MRPHSIIRTFAAAALLLVPTVALAAPDQNTNGNNGCPSGQYRNNAGQCVGNTNGQWNNNNNNGRHRDRDDNRGNNGTRNNGGNNNGAYNNGGYNNGGYNNGGYNNGGYNNGGYNNGGYNNGGYNNGGNRSGNLSGVVSSFSPYNLYLSNGTHVELHNGTVINPTGTNLTPGRRVRVLGNWNGDGTFNANEIDVR